MTNISAIRKGLPKVSSGAHSKIYSIDRHSSAEESERRPPSVSEELMLVDSEPSETIVFC